ncbi:hypothetical protein B0H14DRAFT_3176649 [Mycena olivaceomarginata]|nr:hypothetical protein B0H14DRAFT_3176649 [Mycena olivaceomarginata]
MRSTFLLLLSFSLFAYTTVPFGTTSASVPTSSTPAKASTCSFPPEQLFDQLIDHNAVSDKATFSHLAVLCSYCKVMNLLKCYAQWVPWFSAFSFRLLTKRQEQFEFARRAPEFGAALMVIEGDQPTAPHSDSDSFREEITQRWFGDESKAFAMHFGCIEKALTRTQKLWASFGTALWQDRGEFGPEQRKDPILEGLEYRDGKVVWERLWGVKVHWKG